MRRLGVTFKEFDFLSGVVVLELGLGNTVGIYAVEEGDWNDGRFDELLIGGIYVEAGAETDDGWAVDEEEEEEEEDDRFLTSSIE